MEELAAAYEALRGVCTRRRTSAGDRARVIEFDPQPNSLEPGASGSWIVTAGVAHTELAGRPTRLEELEGQFGWISYDSASDELVVASDPFGLFAVYVARRGGKSYVATSALALAKHLRSHPSRLGLEIFLRAGYHFGKVTHWDGIERLEPGSCIAFGSKGAEARAYWRPRIDETVAAMSFKQAVQHCIEVAHSTYATLLTGEPGAWADLTGGFDTRLMVLLLQQAGADFRCNTSGDDNSIEVQIARRIAEIRGLEWMQVTPPDNWPEVIETLIPVSLAWSDGHLDVTEVARTLWGHREKSGVNRSLFVGGGGEHFRNFAWQQEFLNAGRSTNVNLANWIDMRLLHPIDTSVFAQDPTAEVRADLGRRMLAWAAPYASERNTVQLDVMYMYKMMGHAGAYLSAAEAFLQVQVPFYFRPVFTAAFSTNYHYRANHRLMRHMLASLDPRIAAITTANGGPAEPWRLSNLHRFAPYYTDVARRAVSKLSYKATGKAVLSRSDPLSESALRARQKVLLRFAKDGTLTPTLMRSGLLFKAMELDRLTEQARRGDLGAYGLLARIVTVELALRAVDASLEA